MHVLHVVAVIESSTFWGIIGIGTVAWEEMIFNTNKITIFYRQFLLLNYQPPIDSRGTGSSFFFLLVCAGYEKC